ncbi:hypothetical protein [Nonomuraea zeae]|uniref:Uncharacterized protein n=1 Tax=Nonomuraea zeae TaxID=1642303 RepID=A0A5S4FJK5_9ACTN|nr:hypothetical protein [Nonomuraea zeae]TMR20842.1 hypothetical protein ETD85_51770 [Nonomuraea zeae]
MDRAKAAAADTAHTATQQARHVGGELKAQAGQAVGQLRGRVRDEADSQSRRAAQNLRQWADDLHGMTESGKPDSPVQGVLQQVAGTGHKAADYLEDRGFGGAASDVQDFARRRPGLFLAGALAAGFLFGRLAKAGTKAAQDDEQWQDLPRTGTPATAAAPPTPVRHDPVTPVTPPPATATPLTYGTVPEAPTTPVTPPVSYSDPTRYPDGDVR